jgi:putative pilus assembly secretion protein
MRTEVLGVGIGDILKFEATALTRVKVKVPNGTRAGDWVNFSLRDNKLIALTDEQDGYALVQPHNCIIDLRYCAKPENIADTLQQGDRFGIQYIGAPVEH